MKYLFRIILFFISIQLLNAQSVHIATFKTDSYGGPSKSIRIGNKLYFSAYSDEHGRELWCSDGTPSGTHLIKDIQPGKGNGIGEYFELSCFNLNEILYFRGNDGTAGTELWRSDGTEDGTYLVKDTYAGPGNSSIGEFAAVNNILYFTANTGRDLWRSDGTNAGTYQIKNFSIVRGLCNFKGNLYFSASIDNNGEELWKSNGTYAGTKLLKDLNGVIGTSLPCNFHATNNTLYFTAITNTGWELWKTNGKHENTVLVKDINPGAANGVMDFYSEVPMTHIDDVLYFRSNDGVKGYELWKSDGTEAGTVSLSDLPQGPDTYSPLLIVNGKILFNNYSTSHFFQYDPLTGMTSTTGYPSNSSFNNYESRNFLFIGEKMFYSGKDSIYGFEMWQSDGINHKIIQETHLTNNWSSYNSNSFNSVLGTVDTQLLFTVGRNPTNTDIPLYAYNINSNATCFPPSVIVPVPISSSEMHLVWNRIENSINYQLRYRKTSDSSWIVM